MTKNLTPGTAVYGEKRISVEGPSTEDGTVTKNEFRVWNPFRSKVNTPFSWAKDTWYRCRFYRIFSLGILQYRPDSHDCPLSSPFFLTFFFLFLVGCWCSGWS